MQGRACVGRCSQHDDCGGRGVQPVALAAGVAGASVVVGAPTLSTGCECGECGECIKCKIGDAPMLYQWQAIPRVRYLRIKSVDATAVECNR
eukprot:3442504-Rhodomonas_salina.1